MTQYTDQIDIGALLREMRESAGLSLRQVAAKVAKSHVHIGHIERGTKAVSMPLMNAIVLACGGEMVVRYGAAPSSEE